MFKKRKNRTEQLVPLTVCGQRSLVAIGTINVSLAMESPVGTTKLTALDAQSEAITNRPRISGCG